jgi:hypothetical protein
LRHLFISNQKANNQNSATKKSQFFHLSNQKFKITIMSQKTVLDFATEAKRCPAPLNFGECGGDRMTFNPFLIVLQRFT